MYKKNPLLEMRFSYFKEEFFDKRKDGTELLNPKVWHDQLGYKYKKLSSENPVVKDIDKIINSNFSSEGDRFTVQRILKRIDTKRNMYIVEFGYGLNGGSPNEDVSSFDDKWVWYVQQIAKALKLLSRNGYMRPKLMWIEDPKHSDCYSCYCEFEGKNSKPTEI